MTNKEDKMFSNLIEDYNKRLLNGVKLYKKETKKAKCILTNTIIDLVDEITLLSRCASMIYKKEKYEVYMNTIEELKKMLYEKLEEL